MAIKLLLDTNAVIALLNENAGIIESVNTADEIAAMVRVSRTIIVMPPWFVSHEPLSLLSHMNDSQAIQRKSYTSLGKICRHGSCLTNHYRYQVI